MAKKDVQVNEEVVAVEGIKGKVDAMEWITDNGGYPEVGQFTEKKDLQKFYKQLATDILEDWCELEGLTFKPNDDAQIHRMRVAMAILYHHFPKAPAKTKSKSKYAEYPTEDLIKMALDNDVVFEETDSEPIMRMRVIMALRAHGLLEAK